MNNLEKRIKRNIYGKPQSILVIFPPGLSDIAYDEAQYILEHLWFQNKFQSEIVVLKNSLRIDQIHMSAVMELMMRGQCFTDIRLILSDSKIANIPAFENKCESIDWDFYLTSAMSLKLKVDIGGSPMLHEGAMQQMLTDGLEAKVDSIVAGEEAGETTTLFVNAFKYNLVMSISLSGAPLYKRGYRSVLSNSAPLREDIAACCIKKALLFGLENYPELEQDSMFVPFSGTGTFLFETWIARYQFAPALFDRRYAIEQMPIFRGDTFKYLQKQARENCVIEKMSSTNFYCADHSDAANDALWKNISNFKKAADDNQLSLLEGEQGEWMVKADFMKMDMAAVLARLAGNILIPINPPYGLRLGKSNDNVMQYKQIAQQINALSKLTKKRHTQLTGFILCPSEECWSAFCKVLADATIDTYHLTQGGLDIRVAQFYIGAEVSKN